MSLAALFREFRVPYRELEQDGFWGAKTSTLNFCEEVSLPAASKARGIGVN